MDKVKKDKETTKNKKEIIFEDITIYVPRTSQNYYDELAAIRRRAAS